MRNIDTLPAYKFGRLVTADDPATPTGAENGWNFANYNHASFLLIPIQTLPTSGNIQDGDDISSLIGTPTSNPLVEVFFYSTASKLWVKHNPALTFAALGAGIPSSIEFDVAGRQVALKVTGITSTQGVAIYAGGFGRWNIE